MVKKLVVGILLVTVIGGVAAAILGQPAVASVDLTTSAAAHTPQARGNQTSGTQTGGTREPVNSAANTVGDVWSASGSIVELSTVGMTLALNDGSDIFVELGPATYWQNQSITLLAGASVTVDGFFNGTDYHARAVTTASGAVLALRDENGAPLWAGGANGSTDGSGGQGEVQIPADQWVTVDGTVTALTNNGLILQTADGHTLSVSFGRADFWQQQAVTFATGDPISMLGFWQGDQFSAGQVTRTATGERIMLRDPNGRPLWAGPGRGQGTGTGNGGQHGTPQATPTASQ